MLGYTGLEPVPSPLSGVRSNQLSYKPTSRLKTDTLSQHFNQVIRVNACRNQAIV